MYVVFNYRVTHFILHLRVRTIIHSTVEKNTEMRGIKIKMRMEEFLNGNNKTKQLSSGLFVLDFDVESD